MLNISSYISDNLLENSQDQACWYFWPEMYKSSWKVRKNVINHLISSINLVIELNVGMFYMKKKKKKWIYENENKLSWSLIMFTV